MKTKSKLKIGICFFGHLRTYEQCAPFLRRNLLDRYDCDLFMHTWTTFDNHTKSHHGYPKINGFVKESEVVNAYGEFKELTIEEQKPLDLGIVKVKLHQNSKVHEHGIFGIGAQFHSIRESVRLCEEYALQNGIKYDFILCVRPDIWLKKPLNIGDVLESLSEQDSTKGFYTIARDYARLMNGFEGLMANDILFFGMPEVISDILKNTTRHTDRFKPNTLTYQVPELELIKLVKERGWTPYRMDFHYGVDWEIRRRDTKRRRFIRVKISKNYIHVNLLQACMRQLCRLRFAILDWEFDCCVGTKNTA